MGLFSKKKTPEEERKELEATLAKIDAEAKEKEQLERIKAKQAKLKKHIKDSTIAKAPYDHRKGVTTMPFWQDFYKTRFKKNPVVINMETTTGQHMRFIANEENGHYKWRKKTYIVDENVKYWVKEDKLFNLDYHEEYALPIKRRINISKVKQALEESGISEVELASNPVVLERFMNAKIAEGIMKGVQMEEVFRFLKLVGTITLAIAGIHLFIFMQKTGMLQQIKIPGLTG